MKVWITAVGKSPFAVINPIWMSCKSGEFIPERVYMIWNENVSHQRKLVERGVSIILKRHGVRDPEIIADKRTKVKENDFTGFKSLLEMIRDKELERGSEIAVDMTPGRKFMSALLMGLGFGRRTVQRVYYLHLSDERYLNTPLPLIPVKIQKLYEMRSELDVVEKGRTSGLA